MLFAGHPVDSSDAYVRRVFFGALVLILALSGVSVAAGAPEWARGWVLGGVASLVNLLLTASAVRRQVSGTTKRGGSVSSAVNYVLRMGVMAAALIYAASDGKISLLAAIPALFAAQAVLVVGGLTGWMEGQD